MNKDTIDALKEKACLQIEFILDSFGVEYKERYDRIVAPCPVHGGDRADAFSWHVNKCMWRCFSRGCEEKTGADVIGLIRALKDCTFKEAVDHLYKLIGGNLSSEEIKALRDKRANRDFIEQANKRVEHSKIYPSDSPKRLVPHDYLESRGYPDWLLKKYQIGACLTPGQYMTNRIVIPVTNMKGEIVGFTGRTLDENWQDKKIPKWKHSYGSWVSCNLFNIQYAAPFVEEHGVAILCEGPLDVLRFEQAGVRNSVAILGKKFYPDQMNILAAAGATKILDALDTDVAGQSGSKNILKTASYLFEIERAKIHEGKKDIGDSPVLWISEEYSKYVHAA